MSNKTIEKKANLNGTIYDNIEEYDILNFIAVGGDSIVFRGVKRSVGRDYALKFRYMEKWMEYNNYELIALKQLDKCNVTKVAGIIYEIPGDLYQNLYAMVPEEKKRNSRIRELLSPNANYFCVIEDYIAGCNLEEYCRGNISKGIIAHTPSLTAPYEQVVAFQRKLLNWTIQFCEIMTHVTKDYRYLHLDIKPANLMISNETESLTVIDFGHSMKIDEDSNSASLHMEYDVDIGVYGTNDFAAPECCDSPEYRKKLALPSTGILDLRSDIFSFGATLWDCINPQPDKIRHIKETEEGYFRRDLFNSPRGYISEVEDLIVKCTEKNPIDRYQNYEELKAAAIYAEKKLAERDKPTKTLLALSILTGLLTILLIFSAIVNVQRGNLAFEIARNNFEQMAETYTEHDRENYKETATALLAAKPNNKNSYYDILAVSYKDETQDESGNPTYSISVEEEDILLKCLQSTSNMDSETASEIKITYVNTIMQYCSKNDLKSISEKIAISDSLVDCVGMELAKAINECNEDPVHAYEILEQYQEESNYQVALSYLENMLITESNNRKKIAEAKGIDPNSLQSILQ